MKKYKILKDNFTILQNGTKLFRVQALIDIPEYGVAKGDIGGFLEKESNLSNDGLSWVFDNAKIYGNAKVFENAALFGNSSVYDSARISGDAIVYGSSEIYEKAKIYGKVRIHNTKVSGSSEISGN